MDLKEEIELLEKKVKLIKELKGLQNEPYCRLCTTYWPYIYPRTTSYPICDPHYTITWGATSGGTGDAS